MAIIGAAMVPHPPLIVPQVGRGGEKQIQRTGEAYVEAAGFIASLEPETVVVISPHSVMYRDYFHISPGAHASGDLGRFGAPEVSVSVDYDEELVEHICGLANEAGFPAGTEGERESSLDHGTLIPLYFLENVCKHAGIVRIGLSGLPLREHYRMGELIAQAAEETGRRVAVIGSGDLSHKLQAYGSYGFAEEGPQYDERIMDVMGRAAFGELFDFSEDFCEKAAECGHRSFVIMAGALDGREVKAERISHEDITGVGYGVCTFLPGERSEGRCFLDMYDARQEEKLKKRREAEDPYVRLARESLEYYFEHHRKMKAPDGLPGDMLEKKAGVFVSMHESGALRGCIGTIMPTQRCVADEIISNALSAAFRDPRFEPVSRGELASIEISVDELSPIEEIASESDLDPGRYGVIVSNGGRRGLLLPDLEGVDTVSEQIDIARRKAGIRRDEPVKLSRFTVKRHR